MQNILFWFKKYLKEIVMIFLIVISLGASCYNFWLLKFNHEEEISESLAIVNNSSYDINQDEVFDKNVYVDVKGAVKKPGVYEINDESIINDVIKLAGGFKTNAYKNNINLSKRVEAEMVIYVYTKEEYAKAKEPEIIYQNVCKTTDYNIDDCVNDKISIIEKDEDNSLNSDQNDSNNEDEVNNKIININTADVKGLTSLSGIGEAKAETIIDYRNKNGNFKSVNDIMNVSGIGEALFEKIKDYITV